MFIDCKNIFNYYFISIFLLKSISGFDINICNLFIRKYKVTDKCYMFDLFGLLSILLTEVWNISAVRLSPWDIVPCTNSDRRK